MLVRNPGRESGMSAIPFVVSLLFVAGFAIAWYKADQENVDLRQKLQTSSTNAADWQKKLETASNRILELTEVTGYGDAEGKPDKAAMQAALAAFLDKWRERLTIEFTADKYQQTGDGGVVEKIQGDKVRVSYLPAKDQLTNPNLQQVLGALEPAATRMQADVKRYVELLAAEMKSKQEMLAAAKQALTEKEGQYTALQSQLDQQKRSYEEQITGLRSEIQTKEQALQTVQGEIEAVKAEKDKAVATLTSQVNQKAAEIQTINQRERPFVSEGPDGEVVAARSGVAIINRGKKDFLMPGTLFTVLGRIKGGSLVPKGTIKVIVSNDESAYCQVVEESEVNPIQGTDLIQSLTYSPNRQMRFCLIGEFRKMGRSQAEKRLKDLGASIDLNVSSETHYLVVGTPAAGEVLEETDAWKRAKEFGVQILTEGELASMTLY